MIFFISCSNDAYIWNFLVSSGLTKEGAAGLMGNLNAESNLESVKYQNSYKKKIGLTDQEYVDRVNDGRYSEYNFVHDSVGFGLAQWTYYTRKQSLFNFCHGQIGDLNCQLNFMIAELKLSEYRAVDVLLRNSNNIRDCTLKVLFNYEKPYDQSEKSQNKRINYANNFYNTFAEQPTPTSLKFTYAVRISSGKILPEVTNTEDYAGKIGEAITDIAIKVNKGSIKYRVHVKGGNWLGYVTGYNWNDAKNGYAGNHKPIDLVEIIYSGNNELPKYRVSPVNSGYYGWQYGNKVGKGYDGYAGYLGKTIDRIQISP